jgi:hypothetical protein
MNRARLFFLGIAVLSLALGVAQAGEKEDAAVEAAEDWLALVDAGEYAKSWQASSELLQGAVTKEKWEQGLAAVLEPLGRVVSRELKSAQYATELPGAPDGEYVVIQFDTSFENKKSAVETVTPMLADDGVWRVSGYYIK